MNMKDEMFKEFDIDLETADRIAKEYPSLSDSARERMFNMTKKKMNITNHADEDNNNSVHGVEKYNRPRWIKFAGMAAAVAIIAGGIGGGNYLLRNMKDSAPAVSSSSETEPSTESSSSTAAATTGSSVITSITTTTDVITTTAATDAAATTSAVAETTTEATDTKSLTPEEAAHKLTDDYWDYECFFDIFARTLECDRDSECLRFNYTIQYDGWTSDAELTYYKTSDERLTDKSIDGMKKIYNAHYSKNYDPFYSVNAEYTHNYKLFGPSFTADTLPADGKLDFAYTYIEYEGELYQKVIATDYASGYYWTDDPMEITDVTEKSFTLKRKLNSTPSAEYGASPGEVTFKIVFDEDAQDWRIEQKDVEFYY